MKPQWQRRFYFRLALALGCEHPDFLLEKLSCRQLGEWVAFGMLEQIGLPVQPDPDQIKKDENKKRRARMESGFGRLNDKRGT